MGHTTGFAKIEPKQDTNDSSNDESKPYEVKLLRMFLEGHTLMRIQIQEEKQDDSGDPAGG